MMQDTPTQSDREYDYNAGYERVMWYAEQARRHGWRLSDRQLVHEIGHRERAALKGQGLRHLEPAGRRADGERVPGPDRARGRVGGRELDEARGDHAHRHRAVWGCTGGHFKCGPSVGHRDRPRGQARCIRQRPREKLGTERWGGARRFTGEQ